MFNNGEYIVYGTNGLCRIEGISARDFGNGEKLDYYVLKPESSDKTTIYAPVGGTDNFRCALSEAEARELVDSFGEISCDWIENDIERKQRFREALKSCNPRETAKLLKTLYCHKKNLSFSGKKFHSHDEELMRKVENLLFSELSFSLGVPVDDIPSIICSAAGE